MGVRSPKAGVMTPLLPHTSLPTLYSNVDPREILDGLPVPFSPCMILDGCLSATQTPFSLLPSPLHPPPLPHPTFIEVIQKFNLNSSSIRLPLSKSEASDFGSEPSEGSSSNLVRPVSLIPVAYNPLFIIVLSQHLTPQERT